MFVTVFKFEWGVAMSTLELVGDFLGDCSLKFLFKIELVWDMLLVFITGGDEDCIWIVNLDFYFYFYGDFWDFPD